MAVGYFSLQACQMVFYGGRPLPGSVTERELEGWGCQRVHEMKFVSLRQEATVCVELLCWLKIKTRSRSGANN